MAINGILAGQLRHTLHARTAKHQFSVNFSGSNVSCPDPDVTVINNAGIYTVEITKPCNAVLYVSHQIMTPSATSPALVDQDVLQCTIPTITNNKFLDGSGSGNSIRFQFMSQNFKLGSVASTTSGNAYFELVLQNSTLG